MSSFSIVLTSSSLAFAGTLSHAYERPFRLSGEWEMALTHLKCEEKPWPLYVFCDLLEYTHVDNNMMQFLDYCNTNTLRNPYPRYVKIAKKRFSSININIKRHPEYDNLTSVGEITCILHFRKI